MEILIMNTDILAALAYLIDKQNLSQAEIQQLIKITIYESEQ